MWRVVPFQKTYEVLHCFTYHPTVLAYITSPGSLYGQVRNGDLCYTDSIVVAIAKQNICRTFQFSGTVSFMLDVYAPFTALDYTAKVSGMKIGNRSQTGAKANSEEGKRISRKGSKGLCYVSELDGYLQACVT